MEEETWVLSTVSLLLFETISPMKKFKEDFNVVHWDQFIQDQDLYAGKIKALLVSPVECQEITEELLSSEAMINLKVVSSIGIGVDHLDVPLLRTHGIRICNAPGVGTQPTADSAFALMMAIGRRLPEMMDAAKGYEEGEEYDIMRGQRCRGQDIYQATLGIVGLGQIGFEIAKRAQGFRMKILYHNRNRRSKEDEDAVNAVYFPTLEALLPHVDFLMLAAPLTKNTRHMIRMEQLKMMKSTSYLINIARGGLVKTDDLVAALQSGTIAGAALDATDPEPLPKHHPLLSMPNVIVTPHASVNTQGGLNALYGLGVDNVRAVLEGRDMTAELPVGNG